MLILHNLLIVNNYGYTRIFLMIGFSVCTTTAYWDHASSSQNTILQAQNKQYETDH